MPGAGLKKIRKHARPFSFGSCRHVLIMMTVLVLMSMLATLPVQAATVQSISPQGEVHDVRQVTIAFDTDMVALGQEGAVPATVQCSPGVSGQARWMDPRRWTFTFERDLPLDTQCTVNFNASLKALDGTLVSNSIPVRFTTPPWQIDSVEPPEHAEITETGAVFLRYQGAAPSSGNSNLAQALAAKFSCEVNSGGTVSTLPVVVADDQKTRELAHKQDYDTDASIVALRCARPLPTGSSIRLRYQDGTASRTLNYSVRGPFSARFSCSKIFTSARKTEACDPRSPLVINLSNMPSPPVSGIQFTITNAQGHVVASRPADSQNGSVSFAPPPDGFGEETSLTVDLPHDLIDVDGRPLSNAADFPQTIHFAKLPPYLGVPDQGAIIPFNGMRRAPSATLVVRNIEPELVLQTWRAGGEMGSSSDATVLDLAHVLDLQIHQNRFTYNSFDSGTLVKTPEKKFTNELTSHLGAPQSSVLKTHAGLMEFIDTPAFTEPGFYVVRTESPTFSRYLKDQYSSYLKQLADARKQREKILPPCQWPLCSSSQKTETPPPPSGERYAFVQVTNLNPSASLSNAGRSVIWVTALDTAKPVAGAEVAIYSWQKKQLLWRGTTGPDGLADVGESLHGKLDNAEKKKAKRNSRHSAADGYDDENEHAVNQVWIIVRHGHDVVVMRAGADVQSGLSAWGPQPYRVHTVLDRTLFRAGETVHMEHFARLLESDGFAVPPATKLDVEVHYNSDNAAVAKMTTQLNAQGVGQSEWTIPADAKLGTYYIVLKYGDRTLAYTGFHVEEFRTPDFQAKSNLTVQWDGPKQIATVAAHVDYFAGGPAAGLHLHTVYHFDDQSGIPMGYGYWFDSEPEKGSWHDVPHDIRQDSVLDADGNANIRTVIPPLSHPMIVTSETSFPDNSGETMTTGSWGIVWPDKLKLGLNIEPQKARGQPVTISGLALDSKDQYVAGEKVTVRISNVIHRPAKEEEQKQGQGQGQEDRSSHDAHPASHRHRQGAPGKPASTTLCTVRTARDGTWTCEWSLPPVSSTSDNANDDEGNFKGYYEKWLITATDNSLKHSFHPVNVRRYISRGDVQWQEQTNDDDDDNQPLLKIDNDRGPPFDAGDVAILTLHPRRLPATLLLTGEREGVARTAVIALTSAFQKFNWPVRAEDAPNLQIMAHYVYPLDNTGEKPTTDSDSVDLRIEPRQFRLNVDVQPAMNSERPRATVPVTIAVHNADGQPVSGAQITLVALDEALLSLSENNTWNLSDEMLEGRGNSVTQMALDREITKRTKAGLYPLLSIYDAPDIYTSDQDWVAGKVYLYGSLSPGELGGQRSIQPTTTSASTISSLTMRQNLAPLIAWRTDLVSDANGVAHVMVPLNDALTRFRIKAIVTAGADRFGEGEATITSTQPLQLFSSLPPLLRAGDELVQNLNVHNTTSAPLDVTLTAAAHAQFGATDTGQSSPQATSALPDMGTLSLEKHLTLAAGETRAVALPLKVPAGIDALQWQFTARAGNDADALQVTQKIVPALPVTVRAATLVNVGGVNSETVVPVMKPEGALTGAGGVNVDLRPSLVDAALIGPAHWMTLYPYHCLEQESSRFVTLDDRKGWNALMATLPQYLDNTGFARYFPDETGDGSETLTMYVLDVAHAMNWPVPPASRDRMLNALEDLVDGRQASLDWAPDNRYLLDQQLAAQATLAEYGRADVKTSPHDLSALSTQALIDWGRTQLAMPGSAATSTALADVANQLRTRYDVVSGHMRWHDEQAEDSWWYMQSGDTAASRAALLVEQLALRNSAWKQDVPLIAQGLAGRQADGHWSTTIGNAWGTLALRQFASQVEHWPVTGRTHLTFGDATRTVQWNPSTKTEQQPDTNDNPHNEHGDTDVAGVSDVSFPWPATGAATKLRFDHEGTGRPWATVRVLVAVAHSTPIVNGLKVTRTVTPVEQKRKGQWSVGDVYRVRLDLESTATQTWVVVQDALPSGATQLGRGLNGESQLAQLGETNHGWARPVYVERATDSYRAFFRWVPRGHWSVEYTVRLNNAGEFTLPPVHAEAMYAPEVFGEGVAQTMKVIQ